MMKMIKFERGENGRQPINFSRLPKGASLLPLASGCVSALPLCPFVPAHSQS